MIVGQATLGASRVELANIASIVSDDEVMSEVLLCGTALNLELSLVGNLEHGQTTMDRIEHLSKNAAQSKLWLSNRSNSATRSPVLVRGCVSAGSLHSSIVMVIHVMVVGIHIDGIMGIHGKMLQASVGSSSWASVSNGVIVHYEVLVDVADVESSILFETIVPVLMYAGHMPEKQGEFLAQRKILNDNLWSAMAAFNTLNSDVGRSHCMYAFGSWNNCILKNFQQILMSKFRTVFQSLLNSLLRRICQQMHLLERHQSEKHEWDIDLCLCEIED
ncbi:hypothetical protein EV424DRAFT_1345545 [Suillus variegatus]|nr:hypothetical protein EV424DRAFT_1345545 [Suillus variegatus]